MYLSLSPTCSLYNIFAGNIQGILAEKPWMKICGNPDVALL